MRRYIHGVDNWVRFLLYVKINGDCIEWMGQKNTGYGRFKVDGYPFLAHRWAWEQIHGEVPKGFNLDHLCRNRSCVNLWHLEVVTVHENIRRGLKGILRPSSCHDGHVLSGDNLAVYNRRRYCRICLRKSRRDYYAKRSQPCPTNSK